MKFRKLIATAAAVMCAATMAVTSSAFITEVPSDGYTRSSSGMFLVMLYSDGQYDASEKAVTNYGIDCTKIKTCEVTITAAVSDGDFTGDAGGAIVMSSKTPTDANSHNWNAIEWWGVNDEDEGLVADDSKGAIFNKIDTDTYMASIDLTDEIGNTVIDGYNFVQFAFSQYGGSEDVTVVSFVMKDASGNVLISFDANGKANLPSKADEVKVADPAPVTTTAAPAPGANITIENNEVTFTRDDLAGVEKLIITYSADEDAAVQLGACSSANGWAWTTLDFTLPAGDSATYEIAMADVLKLVGASDASELGDATKIYNAGGEAEFEKAEVKVAGKAGNVNAATDSSKGSPDTGAADVAVVAGLAVAAAGAVVLSKKRK